MNSILYLLKTSCQRRIIPKDITSRGFAPFGRTSPVPAGRVLAFEMFAKLYDKEKKIVTRLGIDPATYKQQGMWFL